jgi:hypothetical protein
MKMKDAIERLGVLETRIERFRCAEAVDGVDDGEDARKEYKNLLSRIRKVFPGFSLDNAE